MGGGIFDLERQFAFYGAYHANPMDILIHTVFVWPLYFTAVMLGCFTPAVAKLPLAEGTLPLQEHMILNLSFFVTILYAGFYILLDKKAGSLAAALCFLCWVGTNSVAHRLGLFLGLKVIFLCQLIGWGSQFIGHGVFEKRAPALLDNFVQAFLMAPFFVLLEVLQTFFGYEPYPGFRKSVRARVSANIRDWKLKKQKKSS